MSNFTREQILKRFERILVVKLMKTYQKILHPKVYEHIKNVVDKRGNKILVVELTFIIEDATFMVMEGKIILE